MIKLEKKEIVEVVGVALAAGAVGGLLAWAASTFLNPERSLPPWRRAFLALARDYASKPVLYQWGGGRAPSDYGVDCSGLLIRAQQYAASQDTNPPPLPPEGQTSTVWNQVLAKIAVPQPGDLALYGPAPDHATHVVMVESWNPDTQTAAIIGANGGDKTVTTPDIAQARGAFVRKESTHLYRDGFLGFASFDRGNAVQALSFHAPVLCCN